MTDCTNTSTRADATSEACRHLFNKQIFLRETFYYCTSTRVSSTVPGLVFARHVLKTNQQKQSVIGILSGVDTFLLFLPTTWVGRLPSLFWLLLSSRL